MQPGDEKENYDMGDITTPNHGRPVVINTEFSAVEWEALFVDHVPVVPEAHNGFRWACLCGWGEDDDSMEPNPYGVHLLDIVETKSAFEAMVRNAVEYLGTLSGEAN